MKHIATFILGAALAGAMAHAPSAAAGKFLNSAWQWACVHNKSGGAIMRMRISYEDRNRRFKYSKWSWGGTTGLAICHSLEDVPHGRWVTLHMKNDGEIKFFGGGKIVKAWVLKEDRGTRRGGKQPAKVAAQNFHAQLYRPRLSGGAYYTDNCPGPWKKCYDAEHRKAQSLGL